MYQMKITFEDPKELPKVSVFVAASDYTAIDHGVRKGKELYDELRCGVLVRVLRYDRFLEIGEDGTMSSPELHTNILRRFWDTTTEGKE